MDNLKSNSYQKNIFKKITSKRVLQQTFNYLKETKYLEIIKYNKMIQKRLNISIDNYKKYWRTEIEIIPLMVRNEHQATFIKILNNEHQKYYHIYFNDEKKRIDRNYITKKDKVTKIKIFIDCEVQSFSKLFDGCRCIVKLNLIKMKSKDIIKDYLKIKI
jgi:hypothetical protein